MEFTAKLENFNTRLWSYHVKVPHDIARHFLDMGDKRVVCTLNGDLTLQCAIMSAGDGVYFINLNKQVRDAIGLKEGQKVRVQLVKDTSEFGMPFPEELEEVMAQDPIGKEWFYKLTPGKQRNLIHLVNSVKSTDLRIDRSMVVIEHLKRHEGKIDFRQLNQDLRKR